MMSPHVALASLVTVANLAEDRAMKSKSLIAAVSLQRKPEAKRVSDGDVIVAAVTVNVDSRDVGEGEASPPGP